MNHLDSLLALRSAGDPIAIRQDKEHRVANLTAMVESAGMALSAASWNVKLPRNATPICGIERSDALREPVGVVVDELGSLKDFEGWCTSKRLGFAAFPELSFRCPPASCLAVVAEPGVVERLGAESQAECGIDRERWGPWFLSDEDKHGLFLCLQHWATCDIPLFRITSSNHALDWVAQVSKKVGRDDEGSRIIASLIWALDDLLDLQGTLCGGGLNGAPPMERPPLNTGSLRQRRALLRKIRGLWR